MLSSFKWNFKLVKSKESIMIANKYKFGDYQAKFISK
jgi:hypothetical protein